MSPNFEKIHTTAVKGRYRHLTLDGHENLYSINFELFCRGKDIITLCMPPHSSHLLQPLDVGCFAPLKQAYGRQIEDLTRGGITHIAKEDFLPAFFAAYNAAIIEKNIQGGFKGSGIYPINPESVISKLDIRLQTPTSSRGGLGLSPPMFQRRQLPLERQYHNLPISRIEFPDIKMAPQHQFTKQCLLLQRGRRCLSTR